MENKKNKNRYEELLAEVLGGERATEIVHELDTLGYFMAPADKTGRFAYPGGAADFALSVCDKMLAFANDKSMAGIPMRWPEGHMPVEKIDADEQKKKFIRYAKDSINRPGIDKLMEYIEKSGFFNDPASTRFHEAYVGGLCEHSNTVFEMMNAMLGSSIIPSNVSAQITKENAAISTLFHDLCKMGYYKPSTRNVKNEQTGRWEQVPSFTVEDKFPYGHGERSAFIIERYMRLRVAEAIAIRWHMGGFDAAAKSMEGARYIREAYDKYPIAVITQLADELATYMKPTPGEEVVKADRNTIILASLLSNIGVAEMYVPTTRNKKNDAGEWEKVVVYENAQNTLPMGIPERSVILAARFIGEKLTDEMACAIRWQKGGFDPSCIGGAYYSGDAFNMYPFAAALSFMSLATEYLDTPENPLIQNA